MILRTLLLSTLFLVSPAAMAAWEYKGFTIDDSLLDSEQKARFSAISAPALRKQIAIVEEAGLPPDILDFFKRTKIRIDPAMRGQQPGMFTVQGGQGLVTVRPVPFAANRPILLHELLHAYYFDALPRHPAILEAYDGASRTGVYPAEFQRAHFLENPTEFFAVTATIYLFGRIQQPPFDCQVLAKNDPAYLAFLEKTFGRRECN